MHWSVIGSVEHWRRRKLWSLVTLSLLHCAPFIADHHDVDDDLNEGDHNDDHHDVNDDHDEDDHDDDYHDVDDDHDEDDEDSDDVPADTAPFSLKSILTIKIIMHHCHYCQWFSFTWGR